MKRLARGERSECVQTFGDAVRVTQLMHVARHRQQKRVQNFGPLLPDNRTHSYRASEPTRVPMTLHCPSPPTLQTSRSREMSATSYVFCMLRCKAASDAWERGHSRFRWAVDKTSSVSLWTEGGPGPRTCHQRHFRISRVREQVVAEISWAGQSSDSWSRALERCPILSGTGVGVWVVWFCSGFILPAGIIPPPLSSSGELPFRRYQAAWSTPIRHWPLSRHTWCKFVCLSFSQIKMPGSFKLLSQCKCLKFGDRILDMELFNSLHETSPRASIISVDFCHMSRSFVSFQ
jgi:hypothetical protein